MGIKRFIMVHIGRRGPWRCSALSARTRPSVRPAGSSAARLSITEFPFREKKGKLLDPAKREWDRYKTGRHVTPPTDARVENDLHGEGEAGGAVEVFRALTENTTLGPPRPQIYH